LECLFYAAAYMAKLFAFVFLAQESLVLALNCSQTQRLFNRPRYGRPILSLSVSTRLYQNDVATKWLCL